MREGRHCFLREINTKTLRILVWEGQHFFPEKNKKNISLRILVWEGQHFFLREIKQNISLRILVWEGQHFFLREKKYFSKDFGVGGSAFFP